jgi:hypothetical protein
LPEGMSPADTAVSEVRLLLEQITGVKRVFVVLATSPRRRDQK